MLWVPTGESAEFSISGLSNATLTSCDKCANVEIHPEDSSVTVAFTQNAGKSIVTLEDGSKVVLLDRSAAYLFWAPSLSNDPMASPNSTSKVYSSPK